MPPKPVVVDPVLGPLTLDRLARDVWVYQRSKGHRFSADDVATAFVAYEAAPSARRVLDLGCGLGSVLLLLASRLPDAELVGVEAQAQSFELLSRNVAHNALGGRVAIVHGDLRDVSPEGPFDLVTGTPPYFPPGHALDAADEQRTYARIEHRGGVEAYVHAAARVLAGEGTLVLCGEARAESRVSAAASEVGLSLVARTDIVARAGKPPLFAVWTLRRAPAPERRDAVLVLRDAEGNRTEDAARLRAFSGVLGPAPTQRKLRTAIVSRQRAASSAARLELLQ